MVRKEVERLLLRAKVIPAPGKPVRYLTDDDVNKAIQAIKSGRQQEDLGDYDFRLDNVSKATKDRLRRALYPGRFDSAPDVFRNKLKTSQDIHDEESECEKK
jgi:hypothetical protein